MASSLMAKAPFSATSSRMTTISKPMTMEAPRRRLSRPGHRPGIAVRPGGPDDVFAPVLRGSRRAELVGMMTPPIALPFRLLGYAGLIPFVAAAALALLGPTPWRGFASAALAAYGATILSFLGAVHWGLGPASPAGEERRPLARTRPRGLPRWRGWRADAARAPGLALLARGLAVAW
jgi:hypothetical protein